MISKKSILSLIILGAIIIGGVFAFLSYKDNKMNESAGLLDGIEIEEKTIVDNTAPFKINVVYPQVSGLDDFNKMAKDIVDAEIDNFKTVALENDKAIQETDPANYEQYPRQYELSIGYDQGRTDKDIISLVFNIYGFVGGAHGTNRSMALNYNVKTGKELLLSAVFAGEPDYIQKISDYCIKNLTEQMKIKLGGTEGTWIQDGAGPSEDNFAIFLVNPNNVTFYFMQYQVAYGAAGSFKVVYPR